MPTADQITDTYAGGRWVRRWTLARGHPRCLDDAVSAGTDNAAAALAVNAGVRADIAAVEAYEAAERLVTGVAAAGEEPPETLPSVGPEGEPVAMPNPAWEEWQAALEVLATAPARTRALAVLRRHGSEPPPADLPDGEPNPARAEYDAALNVLEG
jgi:hypothetical protein